MHVPQADVIRSLHNVGLHHLLEVASDGIILDLSLGHLESCRCLLFALYKKEEGIEGVLAKNERNRG